MQPLQKRLEQVATLRAVLEQNKDRLIQAALTDCVFTYRESALEVATVQDRLAGFPDMAATFALRQPLAGPGQEVVLILPYNGSAWLNTAIVSIYLVGKPGAGKICLPRLPHRCG